MSAKNRGEKETVSTMKLTGKRKLDSCDRNYYRTPPFRPPPLLTIEQRFFAEERGKLLSKRY